MVSEGVNRVQRSSLGGKPCLSNPVWRHSPDTICWTLLVAPYCAIPRDYLSDTPPLRAMGCFGVSTWPIGCDTPSPFSERFPLGEHAKWRCDTPLKRGISAILARYPMKTRCDTPLCDTISKGYCAIWGVSRTGPLSGHRSEKSSCP